MPEKCCRSKGQVARNGQYGKKEHTKYAASQRQTGGGKKPASPVSATKKIIDLFGEDSAFSGIAGGIESGKQTTILISYSACRSRSNYKILLPAIFPLWLNWKTEVPGSQFESKKQTFSCFADAKCFFVYIHDTETFVLRRIRPGSLRFNFFQLRGWCADRT